MPAVLLSVLCCFPLGIPALLFAIEARSKSALGLMAEAARATETSSKFTWAAVVLGIIFWLFIASHIH